MKTMMASIRCTSDMKVIEVRSQMAMLFVLTFFSPRRFELCIATQYITVYYQFRSIPTNTKCTETCAKNLIRKNTIHNHGEAARAQANSTRKIIG
jgi:hypothetical protein